MLIFINEDGYDVTIDTNKYYYDDIGNEYWYDSTGKKHYTREEG